MLVDLSKNAKICVTPNAKHKICVTPNATPQRKPMEYRLRWVLNSNFSRWPCTFHVVCAHFIRTQFTVEYRLTSIILNICNRLIQIRDLSTYVRIISVRTSIHRGLYFTHFIGSLPIRVTPTFHIVSVKAWRIQKGEAQFPQSGISESRPDKLNTVKLCYDILMDASLYIILSLFILFIENQSYNEVIPWSVNS